MRITLSNYLKPSHTLRLFILTLLVINLFSSQLAQLLRIRAEQEEVGSPSPGSAGIFIFQFSNIFCCCCSLVPLWSRKGWNSHQWRDIWLCLHRWEDYRCYCICMIIVINSIHIIKSFCSWCLMSWNKQVLY